MTHGVSRHLRNPPDDPLNLIAERATEGLELPIDLESVLSARLPVRRIEWSHSVDALTIWRDGSPVEVLLRDQPGPSGRRQRMTMAHELGHCEIPWHIGYGQAECHAEETHPTAPVIDAQEAEARRFGGLALAPYSRLAELAENSASLGDFFHNFDVCEMSAQATCIRICQVLRPGFVLREHASDGTTRQHSSPGTGVPNFSNLQKNSSQSGEVTIGGKLVEWSLLAEDATYSPSPDTRRPSEILHLIIAEVKQNLSAAERQMLFYSYQGKMGGGLGKGEFSDIQDVYRQANQRAAAGIPEDVRTHPLWRHYVAKTVANRWNKYRS